LNQRVQRGVVGEMSESLRLEGGALNKRLINRFKWLMSSIKMMNRLEELEFNFA